MAKIELQRDHTGKIHMLVGGQPAAGAEFVKIDSFNNGMAAVFVVPLANLTLGEVNTVVPLVRPERGRDGKTSNAQGEGQGDRSRYEGSGSVRG